MAAITQYKTFKMLLDVNWASVGEGQLVQRIGDNVVGQGIPSDRGIKQEVWIGLRNDTRTGLGSPDDPLNGSTQPLLDTLLPTIPTSTRIHFDAGNFITHTTQFKEGWRIVGAGADLTTIQLQSGVANSSGTDISVFNSPAGFLNYVEVMDLTLDTNSANQGIFTGNLNGFLSGIKLAAKSARIGRVKLIGAYSKSAEGFPLHIEHDGSTNDVDFAEIFDCQVLNPIAGTDGMTAISIFDQLGGHIQGGQYNNLVTCSTAGNVAGYGGRNLTHFKFIGNRALGTNAFMVIDTGDFSDVEIDNNSGSSVPNGSSVGGDGIVANGSGAYDVRIFNNNLTCSATGGVPLVLENGSLPTNPVWLISANTFVALNGSKPAMHLSASAKGQLRMNIITESTNSTMRTGVKHTGNTDASGNLLYSETV